MFTGEILRAQTEGATRGVSRGGGGGDRVFCPGSVWVGASLALADLEEFQEKLLPAEIYEDDFVLRLYPDREYNLAHFQDENLVETFFLMLERINFYETKRLRSAYERLTFVIHPELVLPEFDDDGIKLNKWNHTAAGCIEQQLAFQNIDTGVVDVSGPLYWDLPRFSRVIMRIHEAYIQLLKHPSEETTYIRDLVGTTFSSPAFKSAMIAWLKSFRLQNPNGVCADELDSDRISVSIFSARKQKLTMLTLNKQSDDNILDKGFPIEIAIRDVLAGYQSVGLLTSANERKVLRALERSGGKCRSPEWLSPDEKLNCLANAFFLVRRAREPHLQACPSDFSE